MMERKSVGGYRLLLGYIGIFAILIGIICLLPLLLLIFYPEEIVYAAGFVYTGLGSIILGFLLSLFIRNKNKKNQFLVWHPSQKRKTINTTNAMASAPL